MAEKTATKTAAPATTATVPRVKWDDSSMVTTYANVCNVSGTREEVALIFGTNQTGITDQAGLRVLINNRIILSPFAAKRLAALLGNVVEQYEKKFGSLGE